MTSSRSRLAAAAAALGCIAVAVSACRGSDRATHSPAGPVAVQTVAEAPDPRPVREATPVPGAYRYRTRGSFGVDATIPVPHARRIAPMSYARTTKLVVDEPSRGRQRSRRVLQSPDGGGWTISTTLDYRPAGVRLTGLGVEASVAGLRYRTDFAARMPDLMIAAGAQSGEARSFDLSGQGAVVEGRATVVGREPVNVAGHRRSALGVRIVLEFRGSLRGRFASTTWYSPERLVLREHADFRLQVGQAIAWSKYRVALEEPRPAGTN